MQSQRSLGLVRLVGVLLMTSAFLVSCSSPVEPPPVLPDDCSQLVIGDRSIAIVPGDGQGTWTGQTEVYFRNPMRGNRDMTRTDTSSSNSIDVQAEVFVGRERLGNPAPLTLMSKDTGIEVAVLMDLAPSLLASPPRAYYNQNKRYYLEDTFDAVLASLGISQVAPHSNLVLVARPGRVEWFSSVNAAHNFMVESVPLIATYGDEQAEKDVRQQLADWMADRTTPFPRLIVILRLHETWANQDSYPELIRGDPATRIPAVVLDIGQSVAVQKFGNVTIVPTGEPPAPFDATEWPSSPEGWKRHIQQIQTITRAVLTNAILSVSQVFDVPTLRWDGLLTAQQAKVSILRLTLQPGPGVMPASCSRPLDFSGTESAGIRNYLALNTWIVLLASTEIAICILYWRRLPDWLGAIKQSLLGIWKGPDGKGKGEEKK